MRSPSRLAGFIIFVAVLIPLHATAGGFFVLKGGDSIRVKELLAFVLHDDGVEELVLSAIFDEVPDEFGWIVPLPSVPELTREEFFLFEQLESTTEWRQYRRSPRGAHLSKHGGAGAYRRRGFVSTATSGIYDATIIEPADVGLLGDWVSAQGFRMPENADDLLDGYNREGWVLAAMRIRPEDWTRGGRPMYEVLEPVRFTFQTAHPVLPLTDDGSNETKDVTIYVSSRPPLVPIGQEAWQSHIYSRDDGNVWLAGQPMGDAGDFLPMRGVTLAQEADQIRERVGFDWLAGDRRTLFLTAHRRQSPADQISDTGFVPYNPIRALSSPDSSVRWEAITDLGLRTPDDAAEQLLRFLGRSKPGPETYVTLWALGQAGSGEAEQALLGYIGHPDTEARLEAIEALAALRSRQAIPHFVRGLEMSQPADTSQAEMADRFLQRACFDHLVEYGDSTCLADLRQLVDFYQGREKWDECATNKDPSLDFPLTRKGRGLDTGILAFAAMSACGDAETTELIIDAIVVGGEVEPMSQRVTPIGISGVFARTPTWWPRGDDRSWSTLWWAHQLFDADRDFRDRLYREAALDPRLPDVGRIILVASLDTATDADIEVLMEIYDRSIRNPSPTIEVADPIWQSRQACRRSAGLPPETSDPQTIPLDLHAYAIANALGRQERTDELNQILSETPETDPMLRGEIAFVMARTSDPRFHEVVLDYIRDVWLPGAAIPENLEEFQSLPVEGAGWVIDARVLTYPLDLAYRIRPIENYLFADPEVTREVITDRDRHPYLRLRWLQSVRYGEPGFEGLRGIALEELIVLEAEQSADDPVFGKLADELRSRLDRADE